MLPPFKTKNTLQITSLAAYASETNKDLNQVGVQRFNWKQEFWWGAQSRGLIKPGHGHCYFRALIVDEKQLKQRLFRMTHVNQKWTLCILKQWVYPNLRANPFYKSKDTKQYNFGSV